MGDIGARLDSLRDFPESGARRDLLRHGLRMITRHHYIAYYEVRATEVVVYAVVHGARDIEAIVAQSGFEE